MFNWSIKNVRHLLPSLTFKRKPWRSIFATNKIVKAISLFFVVLTIHLFFRLLSSPTCPVLEALGNKLSFEIAVGLNGRVWVCFYVQYCSLFSISLYLPHSLPILCSSHHLSLLALYFILGYVKCDLRTLYVQPLLFSFFFLSD